VEVKVKEGGNRGYNRHVESYTDPGQRVIENCAQKKQTLFGRSYAYRFHSYKKSEVVLE